MKRLLLAVDGSSAALEAAGVCFSLAADLGAVVRVVTIVRSDGRQEPNGEWFDHGRTDHLIEESRSLLTHVEGIGRRARVAIESHMLRGEPARTILDEARSWQADCIILGRSDHGGPVSAYSGGVTAAVIEFSECPVLVVPWTTRT